MRFKPYLGGSLCFHQKRNIEKMRLSNVQYWIHSNDSTMSNSDCNIIAAHHLLI